VSVPVGSGGSDGGSSHPPRIANPLITGIINGFKREPEIARATSNGRHAREHPLNTAKRGTSASGG